MNIKDRFNEKWIPVTESGCWLWTAGVDRDGYGRMCINKSAALAHRISAEIHGILIDSSMNVCHKCDVPSCVNPDHLFVGTHKENMMDRDKKGRVSAKLTKKQVLKILADGREYKYISAEYNTSISNISMIKTGKNWKHLGE